MESITVTIPASPEYLQVVRLIASGLASRLGFTYDEIEDLKIAVDELCAYVTGAKGRDGNLEIKFGMDEDRLHISGEGHFVSDENVRTDLTEFSQMILETVVDSATLAQENGTPKFGLVKSRS